MGKKNAEADEFNCGNCPLQLYELEAIAGDFTQPNSQEVLLARM